MWTLLLTAALALADAPPTSPGRLSAKTLDAHLDQLIPIVEDVTGRQFASRPEVVLARPGATREVYVTELETVAKRLYEGLDDEQAHHIAFWIGQDELPHVLGKYGIETKKIYLRPKAVRLKLIEWGLPRRHQQDALRLVLAHELVHALQDQTAGLGDHYDRVLTWEALRSLGAVSEGHAFAVQNEVARRLGLHDVGQELTELFGDTYHLGLGFLAERSDSPVTDWSAIEAPPERTGQIFHPETYGDGRDIVQVSHGPWFEVASALGRGDWGGLTGDVGEWELHEELLPISYEARQGLGVGVQGGRVWTANGLPRGTINLWMWVFESDEQAAEVVDAVSRNKARIAARNPWRNEEGFTVVPNLVRRTDVEGLDLHHTRYDVDFNQTYGDTFRKTVVWASDGPVVMQLQLWWISEPDEVLGRTIRAGLGVP